MKPETRIEPAPAASPARPLASFLVLIAAAFAIVFGTLHALRAETTEAETVAEQPTGKLRVTLSDRDTGTLLKDAIVIAESLENSQTKSLVGITNEEGQVHFEEVPPHRFRLMLSHREYQTRIVTSEQVHEGELKPIEIRLEKWIDSSPDSEAFKEAAAQRTAWRTTQEAARMRLKTIVFNRFDVPRSSSAQALDMLARQLNATADISSEFVVKWAPLAGYSQGHEFSLSLTNPSATQVLDQIMKRVGHEWTVVDHTIWIFPSETEAERLARHHETGVFSLPAFNVEVEELARVKDRFRSREILAVARSIRLSAPASAGSRDGAKDSFAPPSAPTFPGTLNLAAANIQTPVATWAAPNLSALGILPPPDSTPGVAPFPHEDWNREGYDRIERNPYRSPLVAPLSTFSLDVDTASYSNARRFIQQSNQLPPWDAVRIEEFVNYFPYAYGGPTGEHPLAVHTEVADSPWKPQHRLVKIGVKARDLDWSARRASNLVFLLDVSGSMRSPNKLGLVKQSMRMLVENLDQRDTVAIVVYAGASGLVLPATEGHRHSTILDAIERLQAGGSTNAGAGIELAYQTAQNHFIEGGNNRVILCTDGDFNVGTTDRGALTRIVEEKAKAGVQLSVLGFGMGNLKDDMLETLSNKGDGTYGYIDTQKEARKVFVEQLGGSLFTVARDVKIQVEFNPAQVQAYRLVGYENRLLKPEDFNDDTKDAGDVGAGHTVTAFYEIVPHGVEIALRGVDGLKYQTPAQAPANGGAELLTVKLRYKHPGQDTSQLLELPMIDGGTSLAEASTDFRFATAVAGWAMLLSNSPHLGELDYDTVVALASAGLQDDPRGHRAEFVSLVRQAQTMAEDASGVSGGGPTPGSGAIARLGR